MRLFNFKKFYGIQNRRTRGKSVKSNNGEKTLREYLDGKTVKEASNGLSILVPGLNILREGIVISPLKEKYVMHFGRLILKQRSPEYLLKHDT